MRVTVCNMCGCRSDPSGKSSQLSVEDELQNFATLQVRVVKVTRVIRRSAKISILQLIFCLIRVQLVFTCLWGNETTSSFGSITLTKIASPALIVHCGYFKVSNDVFFTVNCYPGRKENPQFVG